MKFGKGFTTPLYAETGRYASGWTGEDHWQGETVDDHRMHQVGEIVAKLHKLADQLNFHDDVQTKGFTRVQEHRMDNFHGILSPSRSVSPIPTSSTDSFKP